MIQLTIPIVYLPAPIELALDLAVWHDALELNQQLAFSKMARPSPAECTLSMNRLRRLTREISLERYQKQTTANMGFNINPMSVHDIIITIIGFSDVVTRKFREGRVCRAQRFG